MMIKSILLQLSKLRQSDSAFGLRDGTGQHNDTRVRSDSMDDLNINRRFACPSSHIFFTGPSSQILIIGVKRGRPKRRNNLNGDRWQAKLFVKNVHVLL